MRCFGSVKWYKQLIPVLLALEKAQSLCGYLHL